MFATTHRNHRRSSGYRSARAVQGHGSGGLSSPRGAGGTSNGHWSTINILLLLIGMAVLVVTTILPMVLLETSPSASSSSSSSRENDGNAGHVSLHNLITNSAQLKKMIKENTAPHGDNRAADNTHHMKVNVPDLPIPDHPANIPPEEKVSTGGDDMKEEQHQAQFDGDKVAAENKDEKAPAIVEEHKNDNPAKFVAPVVNKNSLARGVSGLPMSKTPALVGAQWGHVECDVDVDDIVYWNDPQGARDNEFVSPFAEKEEEGAPTRYLTFQPDPGGWNNIR